MVSIIVADCSAQEMDNRLIVLPQNGGMVASLVCDVDTIRYGFDRVPMVVFVFDTDTLDSILMLFTMLIPIRRSIIRSEKQKLKRYCQNSGHHETR